MPLDVDKIRARFPGREIHWHDTIASTMPEAVRLANAGAPHGTVVGADEQTAGHGRYQRTWHSERDTGLYQTVILRQGAPQPVITLALGLAVHAALARFGIATDLRWPNDVLMNEKKVAGILVQLHGTAVIAGIGINVNQSAFPPDVTEIATSLRIETARGHNREDVLIALLEEIDTHTALDKASILDAFTQHSTYVQGKQVIVDDVQEGTTAGLTPEGFLRLLKPNGSIQTILAGGVRPAFPSAPMYEAGLPASQGDPCS